MYIHAYVYEDIYVYIYIRIQAHIYAYVLHLSTHSVRSPSPRSALGASPRAAPGFVSAEGYSASYKEGLLHGFKRRGFCCCCFAACGKYFYGHTVRSMNRDNGLGMLIEI